ncbi:hypothetical protein EUTSA_v10001524mg [Eutrema salsugineum]|uniref:F-box associated beta-propeller type 3 domain-containing protein n=2 Tax=Eutrema salsugineum TaxID=72664 RepID=V4LGP4_EUTSA|nr:hypothetical protein EUTSA_v10001524mg [Eutrema salsugineum]
MSVQKSRKILLAANNCKCGDRPSLFPESRFEGDQEIAFLHCDAERPSMAYNGLVCLPEPDWIIVLNPSTGQILRFPSGIDTESSLFKSMSDEDFLGNCIMGFGRDAVRGSYKVVNICVGSRIEECDVLDVETGEWKKVRVPRYVLSVGRRPACVNGSMYWLFLRERSIRPLDYRILALDLHKQEFHIVSVPDTLVTRVTQVVNLDDRLVAARAARVGPECMLEICRMNAEEETWTKIYSISLASLPESTRFILYYWPVSVSKQGDLVFYTELDRKLLKYYSKTGEVRCLSMDMPVISPYLENLAPLRSQSGHHHHHPGYQTRTSGRCRLFLKHPDPGLRIITYVRSLWN